MGRIIAIDYGQKRTGIAVSDAMRIIAQGLDTVRSCDAVDFLKAYILREAVDCFVVGLPRQANGEASENMRHVEAFVVTLRRNIPGIPVEYCDERFTSVMAHKAMIDGGLKRKQRQDKALVDKISATIILQSYLENKRIRQDI